MRIGWAVTIRRTVFVCVCPATSSTVTATLIAASPESCSRPTSAAGTVTLKVAAP